MSQLDSERLIELVAEKLKSLMTLRSLCQKQAEALAAAEMSSLLNVLAAKQRHLNALEAIERGLDPFRSEDPAARKWSSPARREQCAALLDRCEAVLAEIVAADKQSIEAATMRRDAAEQQLQGTHAALKAVDGYQRQSGQDERRTRLDFTSEA